MIARHFAKNLLSSFPKPTNVAALLWKNFIHISHNPSLILFQFILPAFIMTLFSLAVGKNLKGLKVVYVNDDSLPGNFTPFQFCNGSSSDKSHLGFSNLGDLYVNQLTYHTNLDAVSM